MEIEDTETHCDQAALDADARKRRLSDVLVGGNHLASQLINRLGADFSEKYPPDLDSESALRMLHATVDYDIWCCWAAIMRARAALSE